MLIAIVVKMSRTIGTERRLKYAVVSSPNERSRATAGLKLEIKHNEYRLLAPLIPPVMRIKGRGGQASLPTGLQTIGKASKS
jgi:hypothetical protein